MLNRMLLIKRLQTENFMIEAISTIACYFSWGYHVCLLKKNSIQQKNLLVRLSGQWMSFAGKLSFRRPFSYSHYCKLHSIAAWNWLFSLFILSGFLFSLLVVQGCKTTSGVTGTVPSSANSAAALLDSMQRHAFYFDWFTGKARVEVYEDGNKTEFTASIRIRKDSAIWLSISPALGLEAARVLITHDSIRVIDRLNGESFSKDYRYFTGYTSLPVTYDLLQDLIMGVPLFSDLQTFDVSRSDSAYTLVSNSGNHSNRITLNRVFLPVQQTISDSARTTLSISQQQYEIPYTTPFSLWRKIELQQRLAMKIIITFSKIKVNEPVKLPFGVNE